MIVGHTHDDIDALFGRWAMSLRSQDFPTLPMLMKSFMDLEKEVVIPDAELTAKAKAEQARAQQAQAAAAAGTTAPPAPAPSAGGGHYMLQVVATGDARAADEFKARLAMLGFAAKVYTSTSDGKTINRVRLGPYASASETEAAKKALAENSINSFPVADAPGH